MVLSYVLTQFMPLGLASPLAFTLAGAVALYGNYNWTYYHRMKIGPWKCTGLFAIGVAVFGWVINKQAVTRSLHYLQAHPSFAPDWLDFAPNKVLAYAIAAGITLPFSVIWNHQVVFRHMDNPPTVEKE